MNNILGSVIKEIRKDKKITQSELARLTGFKQNTISNHENGKRSLDECDIYTYAKALNVSPQTFFDKYTNQDKNILSIYNQLHEKRQAKVYNYAREQLDEQNSGINEKRSIYVVGTSAAGEPIEYGDFDSEMIQTDVPAKADKAIHIKGDSMEPKIANNSIIFYHEQPTLEIGEIGIFEINGSAVTCKKYYVDYESKKIVLKSINPKYEPMYFNGEQVRILGKVVF